MNAKIMIAYPFPNIVMAKCKICGYKIKIQSVDNEPLKDYQLPSKCPCCGWQMEEEVSTTMALKIDYHEVMVRMKKDVDYIAEEAYTEGYTDGKKFSVGESVKNAEYQRGFEDGKKVRGKKCEGCEYEEVIGEQCRFCSNRYPNQWTAKKQDDKIKVGDEVKRKTASENDNCGIVTREWEGIYYIMWSDGSSGKWNKNIVVKTGRHFDIDKILKEMTNT